MSDNLRIERRTAGKSPRLACSLGESSLTPVDYVAFANLAADDFGVELSPEDRANHGTVGELVGGWRIGPAILCVH